MRKTTLITLIVAAALAAVAAPELASAATGPHRTPLTRIYRGDDGGVLYLRQLGTKVYGFGEFPGRYAYALSGTLLGDRISSTWWDVAKDKRRSNGTTQLQWSQGGARLVFKGGTELGPRVFAEISPSAVPWPYGKAAGFQSTSTSSLDGLWLGDDETRFYVREQSGSVAAVVERDTQLGSRPAFASVLIGTRSGTGFSGTWVDVPKGPTYGSGTFGAALIGSKRELAFTQTGAQRAKRLVPEYTLDWDAFAASIVASLDKKVVGYAYAITRHGGIIRSGAGGLRRLGIDGGALPFTTSTQAQTASTAKTIYATALIKALTSRGLTVDSRAEPFLPSCWKRGPGVSTLTFRQILDHTSGLPKVSCNGGDAYECLLKMIAEGRTQPRARSYNTHAYDLLRILTPMVLDRTGIDAQFELLDCKNSKGILNGKVSEKFARYMFDEVLDPANASASFYPSGDFSLNYDFSNQKLKGVAPQIDYFKRAGSGKLTISTLDYIRFLSAFDRGLIISKSLVETMKTDLLAFDGTYGGTAGSYVWKNGGCPWFPGTATQGCKTVAMILPGDTQLYIATNSDQNGYSGNIQSIAGAAYDAGLAAAFR